MLLNDKNFELFAAKSYDNINCIDMIEFYEDLNRIKYLKKLLKRYKETGEIKPRLILNHFIVLYNVFNPPLACTSMIVLKLHEYLDIVKPFLIQLSFWPDKIILDGRIIIGSDVGLDKAVVELLRLEFATNDKKK